MDEYLFKSVPMSLSCLYSETISLFISKSDIITFDMLISCFRYSQDTNKISSYQPVNYIYICAYYSVLDLSFHRCARTWIYMCMFVYPCISSIFVNIRQYLPICMLQYASVHIMFVIMNIQLYSSLCKHQFVRLYPCFC